MQRFLWQNQRNTSNRFPDMQIWPLYSNSEYCSDGRARSNDAVDAQTISGQLRPSMSLWHKWNINWLSSNFLNANGHDTISQIFSTIVIWFDDILNGCSFGLFMLKQFATAKHICAVPCLEEFPIPYYCSTLVGYWLSPSNCLTLLLPRGFSRSQYSN